jgi:hypothetical protein
MTWRWGRKNIADRDVKADGDATRRRRDLDAAAAALILYYAAGGVLREGGGGLFMPISFANPCVFLYATWVAFFYFLLRYWMHTPREPVWKMFREDIIWQAADTKRGRMLRDKLMPSIGTNPDFSADKLRKRARDYVVPVIWTVAKGIRSDLPENKLIAVADYANMRETRTGQTLAHHGPIAIPDDDLPTLHCARFHGFWKALFFERTFFEYCLPYLMAAFTIAIAILMTWRSKSCPCAFW